MVKFIFLAVSLINPSAFAASDSLLTAGIGASLGAQQSFAYESSAFIEGRVRVRVLRGLGLEASYNPMVLKQDGPRYDSPLKAFLLIHIIPTTPVGGYVKLGAGSDSIKNLFKDDASASYHAGVGANYYWTDSIAIGVEGVLSFPNFSSAIENFRNDSSQQRYKFSADIFYYL